ncbi:MAG: 3-isopropylmalate dehydrogenase [Anaerolineaceae bacterium]|nr:3-isopropylmalate dehydrogenase [Anaerolineaceae bacterium]
MNADIMVLPGDGIGPEVIHEALRVLRKIEVKFNHQFTFHEGHIGGISMDNTGYPITREVIDTCLKSDAVLLGAVGGPKWDNPSANVRPEQGLLTLRKELEVYANLRPIKVFSALRNSSPIKPDILRNVNILFVRELTGGLYFGKPRFRERINGIERAVDTLEYRSDEIERVTRLAFRLAQNRSRAITSVDKANVLESSRLWREITTEVAKDFPDVDLSHMLVDTAAMSLITRPSDFDVILTENLFGDILTDEASVLSGSMGLLPSASIGDTNPGIFEPIHGSAPDIAGKGLANPIGAILSAALLLRFALKLESEANCIEGAVEKSLSGNYGTPDIGGKMSSSQLTDMIINNISD